ncbi:MAG: alkaline phosphatase family protein [Acidimicrobiales bacterium]|nr:alkaline phosphatase family protein [Acidimicrobiales bacterium]
MTIERAETVDRAEAVLTDPGLSGEVDSILRQTPQGYRAASHEGSVDFVRGEDDSIDVTRTSGNHPLRDDSAKQRTTVAAEHRGADDRLGDHATPGAMASIAQYFDSPHAPDLVILHAPSHRFHGNVGEHGSLATTQARAPFIAAGPGVLARRIVDEHIRTVDVAPTVAALLGCAPIDGHDGLGRARSGVRLRVQDGDEAIALLDPDQRPDHVVLFLWDGCNPQALHEAAASGEAPAIAALIERGTSYRNGAFAALPTATLANHTAETTGVFPGRSGILHNTWYDRGRDVVVDLLDFEQMITARDHIRPDIETIHEALKRNDPDALSVATYEYGDRGADWSTYIQMSTGGRQGPLTDEERRRHRSTDFMGVADFRNYSVYDAHSLGDAKYCWSGDLGGLPRFSWFTLNLTDSAGHYGGPHSEMGRAAIRDSDARMGEIIGEIERRGVLDRTAIVMCADHGMQTTADGEPADLTAPLRAGGVDHLMVDAQYVYLR